MYFTVPADLIFVHEDIIFYHCCHAVCVCVCVCVMRTCVHACLWGGGGAVCVSSLFGGSSVKAFMGHGGGGGGGFEGDFFFLTLASCCVYRIVHTNRSFKTARRLKTRKLFHALGILFLDLF